ncbi:Hypothetical protein R9X50_00481600 [Acrodontium crateriforme]|uniref:RBR-type E3 ubiquitin transferase n=1 Tax=Acrodontium crateriforme TaxID=150365 RepID=A0AAQ3M4Y2_9PEZI|nr:Hypothetical protein R9X50_00481600 [Acrodontium crateriforme]
MPSASVGGYGRRSAVSVRSRRSNGSIRSRPKKASVDEPLVKKPDVEELRKIKATYFGGARDTPRTDIQHDTATSTRLVGRESDRQRKKRHPPGIASKSRLIKKGPTSSSRSASDYVSDRSQPVLESRSNDQDDVLRDMGRRQVPRYHSARPISLSTLAEDDENQDFEEVTPDDSISVVAERQYSLYPRTKAYNPSKLGPMAERPTGRLLASTPRKTAKHSGGLLANLFKRSPPSERPSSPRLVDCLTCGADDVRVTRSTKLECGHRMCHPCLKHVFAMSVKDAAHMPPTCCTEKQIPLKHVDKLFDVKFKTLWNRKYQEYHTKNRIYCPSRRCGEWINPSQIHISGSRKYAACPRCKTKVCVLCNNKMHKSGECPKDPETAELIAQAKKHGWQRCYNCSTMVELEEGCNHMTCRCMAEFCMVCGSEWKTCSCSWFNYTTVSAADRFEEMRIPEPVQHRLHRDGGPGSTAQRSDRSIPRAMRRELQTGRREQDNDAELARRLQFASLLGQGREMSQARSAPATTFGLGNAAPHHMNENFVTVPANVTMSTFGDANMGRRGERASGRKKPAKRIGGRPADRGLVPNFLGEESVLGVPT